MSQVRAHNSPIAIVGLAAIMPQAPDAEAFWRNVREGVYSITEVSPSRWDPRLYYDPDHAAADKTYSKIGGWVREFAWDPIRWKLPVPPKVAEQMDEGQRWAVSAARAALLDAGWPGWTVDSDRVAVILGNAIGGEKHYRTSMRIELPEVLEGLEHAASFAALPPQQRAQIVAETRAAFLARCGEITEDTMPGELSNVMAGRIANLFNFRGPNFTTDAACASGLAAMTAAVQGLVDHRFDAVVTGGVDRNMSVAGFVKFCKIGALSATGTRPFDAGADGFVMGEGCALFVLKRLEDAERDNDRIYAVILGIDGSSDGKGKGITAPNPVGQRLAVTRAWDLAGVDPSTVTSVEAHGTSTRVGDATELESLTSIFGSAGSPVHSIALGSVKSNIGHLKAAAGTAGLFKMARSLHDKVLAPSLNFREPNPNVDWDRSPFQVNTKLREWPLPRCGVRRGGVSAFGFGGTNFHVALEEYVPGRHPAASRVHAQGAIPAAVQAGAPARAATGIPAAPAAKVPLRGALVVGGRDHADLVSQLQRALADAQSGRAPAPAAPDPAIASAAVRAAVDFADAADLAAKLDKLLKALASGNPALFRMLRQQGVFVGRGAAPKVAFLYTGQGSQYVNMLAALRAAEPLVAQTFEQADAVMTPLLGRTLSSFIFIDGDDPQAVAQLEKELRQTEITQPALLASDASLHRLLGAYGIEPDMVMGHSLGEYGALVAAGSLSFEAALEAVSARGREMAHLSVEDNGAMAAVSGPLAEIEKIVAGTPGYIVVANINSTSQAVVGGATAAVEAAVATFNAQGMQAVRIPVSHAFHTSIVAPAAVPLVRTLQRLDVQPPRIPLVANVTGEFYPADATADVMREMLGRQVASPVQFVKGLRTLYDAGARVFVEVGPKRALHGFVEDVLGNHDDVVALFTNHPKQGDAAAFNQALCGLWAAGLGFGAAATAARGEPVQAAAAPTTTAVAAVARAFPASTLAVPAASPVPEGVGADDRLLQLGRLFASAIEQGLRLVGAAALAPPVASAGPAGTSATPSMSAGLADAALREAFAEPVVITGAALGLPGVPQVFDDGNVGRILAGQQMIGAVPQAVRERMVDMHITRLVKSEIGGATFESIDDPADVVKLAGRHAPLDIVAEFAIDKARDEALDVTTRLAIGAGFDALRDAGIPLVMRYKNTTLGTRLPDRWGLPDSLRDDTGVIFASAFPGYDNFGREAEAYAADRARREQLLALEAVRSRIADDNPARADVESLIATLRSQLEERPYRFDRRFLFQALSMGHAQFAEIIGARGPNTQVNAACASTTQTLALAEDWIRSGRCRRVIVVAADDATSDVLLPWIASGFLASGAAATDANVEDAATPFDRRRHGMIVGMGAAALVVESAQAARERGLQPICEVLGAVIANSAYHGTRLDVDHIGAVMEALLRQAEARGARREAIAGSTVFVSHETYTPARGGSASAEIAALRRVFGADAGRIVITNTKGFTGHAMGAGIEDVVAVKCLETGIVPPVPNFREPDPELGTLNLSRGGAYDVRHALRLAAGFGSQVAMSLLRWTPMPDGQRRAPDRLGHAYRIADPQAWQRWIDTLAGQPGATFEVDHRRLRIADRGAPASAAHPSAVPVPYGSLLSAVGGPPVLTAGAADSMTRAPAAPAGAQAPAAGAAALAVASAPLGAAAPSGATPVAAPSAPAAPAVSDAPAATPATADDVLAQVTSIVATMTGYPPDLLDPDLDLEADLGVDTVKQAEVFAAVRGHYGVERDPNLRLRDFPTLRHVAGWVRERSGQGAAPAAPAATPAAAALSTAAAVSAVAPAADEVLERVRAIVAEMTGYPADLLEPDLDLEADLGVDTVKQAEVFAAVRGHYGLERDPNLRLRDFPTLRHVAGWVRERSGLGAAPAAPVPSASAPAAGPTSTDSAPAMSASAAEADEVLERVRAIVAEMTGYPADLLEPDLDLEADLGVDTVKQAEVFAAVRGHYGLERDPNLRLRDFPTLRHVAGWVRERAQLAQAGSAPAIPAPSVPAATLRERVEGDLRAIDALPRRLPVASLRPAARQCLATGITLEGSSVVVMADEGGVAQELVDRLGTQGARVLTIDPGTATDALVAQLTAWQGEGPIAGVYWLSALDAEAPIEALDLAGWHEALRRRVHALYAAMRAFDVASNPFLVAATRLGGQHGYDAAGAVQPMGGAVTGFAKSYRKERPQALVKAVDVAEDAPPAAIADHLVEETLFDPGCVEVGHSKGRRVGIALREVPFPALDGDGRVAPAGGLSLGPDSVFVVTGAAGSIVSAITADLATACGGTFHLLDLAPVPEPGDADLAAFRNDRDSLKQTLAQRLKDRGEKATPVAIERELAKLERQDAAQAAIDAVRTAGGTAHYYAVDLTDAAAVASVIDAVRQASGRIDVLLHAAGLEISRALHDKEPREFDLVFGVKADGWFNVLKAAGDMPIRATVAFSSVAGRFGNAGQTDYAAANDLLCKFTSHLRRSRPGTRALALDWTAWGGIGMATRGSIPKIMEAAGVQMLPPQAGIAWIRRELLSGAFNGEVVVAGALGRMADELHPDGGVDPAALAGGGARGPMLERVSLSLHDGLAVTTIVDPLRQPFLDDHRIDGIPVLPAVMGIEAFAEAAGVLAPQHRVVALENVSFAAPLKFYRDEPRALTVRLVLVPDGDDLLAHARLVAERQLPGQERPQQTVHFSGTVRLSRQAPGQAPLSFDGGGANAAATLTQQEVYGLYFHGPAYRVVGSAWRAGDLAVAAFAQPLPPNHAPASAPLSTPPRLVELCFQAAGLWEAGLEGRLALPSRIDRLSLWVDTADPEGSGLLAQARCTGPGRFDCCVVDGAGRVLLSLEGYHSVPLPAPIPPQVAQALQRVFRR